MESPHIERIRIYPIKSLDPVELEEVETGIHSLQNDRAFAMIAEDGRFVNGKRTGRVNQLKTTFNLKDQTVSFSLRSGGEVDSFELRENNLKLNEYLSDFFGLKVALIHRENGELMDIPTTSSITVVSSASLESLRSDLTDHKPEDLRLRFRANLEIGGTAPYWEERLFGAPGTGVQYSVGEVEMTGVNPRARCNVPPRNPLTGETDKSFVKRMMESRSSNLPSESKLPEHGGFYHLTVNTYLPADQRGKIIRVGDPVKIIREICLGQG